MPERDRSASLGLLGLQQGQTRGRPRPISTHLPLSWRGVHPGDIFFAPSTWLEISREPEHLDPDLRRRDAVLAHTLGSAQCRHLLARRRGARR